MSKYRDIMIFADHLVGLAKKEVDQLKPEMQIKLLADITALRQMSKNRLSVNKEKMREIAYAIKTVAAPLDMPDVSLAADYLWRVLAMVPDKENLEVVLDLYCTTVDVLVREAKSGKAAEGKALIAALTELYKKHHAAWGS